VVKAQAVNVYEKTYLRDEEILRTNLNLSRSYIRLHA